MASLTLPGLETSSPSARARRAGPAGAAAARPDLLQRLLGERDDATAPDPGVVPGRGVTLDELLVGTWEGLTAHRTAACPVCHAEMTPRYGAGAEPVGGRCRGCGSTLA